MKRLLQLIFSMLLPATMLFAGVTKVSGRLIGDYSVNASGIASQRTIFIQDDEYSYMFNNPTWNTVFANQKVINRVQLRYQESARVFYSASWSLDVPVQIKTYNWDGTLLATETCTLTVEYDPGSGTAYKDIDTYTATIPGYRTEVKINGAPSFSGISAVPADVILESTIETERYYLFDETATPAIDHDVNVVDRQITFYWDWMAGAEEYDLEYLFISATDAVAQANPDFNKAVRVTTSLQSYTINDMFEGGEVLYRVRGVGRHGTDFKYTLAGAWGQGSNPITVTNPHTDINWTYMSVFAEEGKRKELLTLYDKSLRPRQQVSLQNSTEIAMISETYYDYEGRAVINTMPAPTLAFDNVLDFYEEQTFKDQGIPAQLEKKQYDNDQNYSASVCGSSSSPGLATTKGASRYYSSSNNLNALTYNTAIPDAEKFPYSQMKYDDQGRVIEEGAPGKSHHIGTNLVTGLDNHTTKYFYASASQDRLDRLFGNEVGYSQHYKERASMDANGQMNLAYMDLSGKVIATSLVGAKPANLDQVSSNAVTPATFTEHFDSQNHYDPVRQAWVVSTDFLVTNPNSDYDFTYELTPEQYMALCNGDSGDCMYNLTITIYDGCRNPMHDDGYDPPSTPSDNILNTTFQLNPYNLTAAFTVAFPHIGTYHIEKVLSLDQEAFQNAVNTFIAQVDDCIAPLSTVAGTFSVSGDCNDCSTWCAQQADAEELVGEYRDAYILDCEIQNCQLSADPGSCEGLRDVMKIDLSPGGQYYVGSWLPDYVETNPGFSWTDFNNYIDDPDNGCGPNSITLADWTDVDANWEDCFAGYLVQFHPEYCHYGWCVDNEESHSYNVRMYSENTLNWAETHETVLGSGNFFIDLALTSDEAINVFNDDPFFAIGGPGNFYNGAMATEMGNFQASAATMWDVAGTTVGCTVTPCDAQWVEFRALYLMTKAGFEKQAREAAGCYALLDSNFPPDFIADGVECDPLAMPTPVGQPCNPEGTNGHLIRAFDYSNQLEAITDVGDVEDFQEAVEDNYSFCKKGATNTYRITDDDYSCHSVPMTSCPLITITAGGVEITGTVNTEGTFTSQQLVVMIVTAINNYVSVPDYTAGVDPTDANQFIVYAEADLGTAGNVSSSTSGLAELSGHDNFSGGTDKYPCPTTINCVCGQIQQFITEWNTLIPDTIYYYVDHTVYTTAASYVQAQLQLIYYPDSTTLLTSTQVENWIVNCAADIGNPEGPVADVEPSTSEPLLAEMNCDQEVDCDEDAPEINEYWANFIYQQAVAAAIDSFKVAYVEQCFGSKYKEIFNVEYKDYEYQYTLYYYDQSGNLTRTVPPAAVQPLNSTDVADLQDYRNTNGISGAAHYPNHVHSGNNMVTNYKYNSFNSPIESVTPDAGITTFFYDKIGRIVASQNAKQLAMSTGGDHYYSYTLYDSQSRITEVGEIKKTTALSIGTAADYASFVTWATTSSIRSQVTSTYYDAPLNGTIDGEFATGQENLRKRVATVTIEETFDSNTNTYDHATHYSYDVHGNVKELIQEFPELVDLGDNIKYKHLSYTYDLISGNVNEVCYQRGVADQFFHHYYYDADNRLTNVYTSRDSIIWDQDAKYFYYLHGPLARTETGDLKVQGQDYAYTIQGWLKGVNSNVLDRTYDLGKDGQAINGTDYSSAQAGLHSDIAIDAFGFTLGYFWNGTSGEKDYTPINSSAQTLYHDATALNDVGDDLFNGNIKKMAVALSHGNPSGLPSLMPLMMNHYHYDQLNRIVSSNSYIGASTTAYTGLTTSAGEYQNTFAYDANGNILTQFRNGNAGTGVSMDDLDYHYVSGTNQLEYVDDAVMSSPYTDDLEAQGAGNYTYDAIGQLETDVSEDIDAIDWNVYGKIRSVSRNSNSKSNLNFEYDAMGNRIVKISKPRAGGTVQTQDQWTYTYYVRDAQGNVMATYKRTYAIVDATHMTDDLALQEADLYGSSRLGVMERTDENIHSTVPYTYSGFNADNSFHITVGFTGSGFGDVETQTPTRELGHKAYELTNHLGNVLVTVSDRKLLKQNGGTIDYYMADVRSTDDYSAFGATMPGRNYVSATLYRHGFNGMENDGEIKGQGNSYSTEYRQYDSRIGRWLSIDPVVKPEESPYASFANNPIYYKDPSGLDPGPPDETQTTEQQGTIYSSDPNAYDFNSGDQVRVRQANGNIYTKTAVVHEGKYITYKYWSTTSVELATAEIATHGQGAKFVGKAATIAGTIELSYSLWESGYDHLNYVTTKGLIKPIYKANGMVRSAQAQEALNWSNGFKATGLGLNAISTTLGVVQVYDQYQQGGVDNINPIDAAATGLGVIGTTANTLSWLGYGGTAISVVGEATGVGGLIITSGQLWYGFYKGFDDLRYQGYDHNSDADQSASEVFQMHEDSGYPLSAY